jgi:hypothetical protein
MAMPLTPLYVPAMLFSNIYRSQGADAGILSNVVIQLKVKKIECMDLNNAISEPFIRCY